MTAISMRMTVVTSATFNIGLFRLKEKKKEKHEEMNVLVIFYQEV